MDRRGTFFHAECSGCISFGTECEKECEYSESPDPCPYFRPEEWSDYE